LGEVGEGDESGLGAEESSSILNIAEMFGAEVEMRPETKGNRMGAKLGFTKAHALG
jgi:UDP-glucose 4-epimerase